MLLESETVEPPDGAAELRVTVPVELLPPVTLVGFRVTDETVGEELPGFTVKLVDTVAPPDCPKIGAVQLVVVLVLPTVKLTLVCPAGTVTGLGLGSVTGRVQGGFCERDIRTASPLDGAGEAIVTVPVELFPPVTVDGLMLIEVTAMPVVTVTEACWVLLPRVAVTVTTVLLRTNKFFAVAWKVAVVAPAGTVTVPGTLRTPGLSSESPTTEPPDPAGALKVTVPVDVPPFGMLEGLNVSDERVPPLLPPPVIVSDASTDPVVTPAEMIAVAVGVAGCVVVMVTVPLLMPAGMMMLAVTEAAALLLVNVTAWPPEGAGLFSVTVPCEELPATTLAGFSVNEEMVIAGCGGVKVSVACCETPFTVAVITTFVFDVTACVVMAKEVVVLLSVMATLSGTLARPLLLESVTTTPPVGAGPVRFTVP